MPEITAEKLARDMCEQATERSAMHFGGAFRGNEMAEAHSFFALNAEFALAYVLREIPPALGDRLAKEIAAAWEDGSQPHELPTEWLREYGIDPEPLIEKHCGPAGVKPAKEDNR